LALLLSVQIAEAQMQHGGAPRLLKEKRLLWNTIPTISLPYFDAEEYRQRAASSGLKSLEFARMFDLSVDIKARAKHITRDDGTIYVLAIRSEGAYSLNIIFDTFRIPESAELFVYNPEFTQVAGAFTARNNKESGVFPVAPVKGDELIIEYFEPSKPQFEGEVHLSGVGHGFIDVFGYMNKKDTGPGASGECNVNVTCDEGHGWQDAKHSVVKIISGAKLCTGALLNNTRFNGTPYLLTANHCVNTTEEAEQSVFYFNYESPDCNSSTPEGYSTLSSSAIVATAPDEKLDFSLLKLSEQVPSNYQPYYAGWNLQLADNTHTTCIHHPSGDVKKISKDYEIPVSATFGDSYDENSHWLIEEWDVGTTEGGSSGAPLFDQHKRIIGDLTGGEASCSYNYNDYFAKISRSWDDFGDTDRRLKPWLDPNKTAFTAIDGYFPYQIQPSNLQAVYDGSTVFLSWNPPVNKENVVNYELFRNDSLVQSISDLSYRDNSVVADSLYFYKVRASLDNGTYTGFSDSTIVFLADYQSVPFEESFEHIDSMDVGWYTYALNGGASWTINSGGSLGVPDQPSEGQANGYFYGTENDTARWVTPKFDLSPDEVQILTFDLSMPDYNGVVDQVSLYIRYADTLPWQNIHTYKSELNFWQTKEIMLPKPTSNYLIAFEAVSKGGGGVYLDDLQIQKDSNAVPLPKVTVSSDFICEGDSIIFSLDTGDVYDSYTWDFGYGAFPETVNGYGPHTVSYNYQGSKELSLTVNARYEGYYSGVADVNETPDPMITINDSALISNYEEGNRWYFNGEPVSALDSSVFYPAEAGRCYLQVENESGCIGTSDTVYFEGMGFHKKATHPDLEVYPNPAEGMLFVEMDQRWSPGTYSIYNVQGQLLKMGDFSPSGGLKEVQAIDIQSLSAGVYILHIQFLNAMPLQRKFVKMNSLK